MRLHLIHVVFAVSAIGGAALVAAHTPPDPTPTVSRMASNCLTDTDCDALADDAALIGLGCTAENPADIYWQPGAALYRNEEDLFPGQCVDIHAVRVVD